ncbi:DUF3883 domain-containing protein [Chryseobacterium mulctrae]|uniref:DUF3883 domain-containing protein n=1 Tax=Chryseobacterium mulctrae TaxID=2576777 RepID=UPI001115CFEB|nr:DUF3883 domain-containing protein [Chryseobacterium mulctrae]
MDLKNIVEELYNDSERTPLRGLGAIAEAEKYLQQAYEGRYFFELIQNVRDANKEIDQDGEILIELANNILSISNTGAEFSAKGIEGITTIGQSTKESQDYIGFKGIGFKSIQEVTEKPRIITHHGTVYFDKITTLNRYTDKKLTLNKTPLFYFPHYDSEKVSNQEKSQGIVTRIHLPLKENITETDIADAFVEIQPQQLILLGHIKYLKFLSNSRDISYSIQKNPSKNLIEIQTNDSLNFKYKYFTPSKPIYIPEDVLETLDGKEKDVFGKRSGLDINIVLEVNRLGQITIVRDAKLFLFYPLEISSGFRFIIHSYFIVNPERTSLRDSAVNNFLLTEIGNFIVSEMLSSLKNSRSNTNKILCFKRNKDAKIDLLYNTVVDGLKNQKFIYDSIAKKYYLPSEVMVTDGFDKGLFPDRKFAGKQLIFSDDEDTISWLRTEFDVPYLSYKDIEEKIENECRKQAKERKIKFFQNLYNYVGEHSELDLTGKNVLLTDSWRLVSSNEDVFYGGGRNRIELPASIKKHIHFIHKSIKIKDFREGRSRTGITEFNTYELIRRILKLFDTSNVPKSDILNTLYNLYPFDVKSQLDVREKILFPIQGSRKWLSPIYNPIYFDNEKLRELYPSGNFADLSIFQWLGDESENIEVNDFSKIFGIWDIPAVYISEKNLTVATSELRDKKIEDQCGLTSRPFYTKNDRVLDIPIKYNHWFSNSVIENWTLYEEFIKNELFPSLQYHNGNSYYRNASKDKILPITSFTESLSTDAWIYFQGEDIPYSINELIGIKYLDFTQPHNQVISKYLKLLPISFDVKKNFIQALGLIHLDADDLQNFNDLLHYIYIKYERETPQEKEFTDFYNRILGKIVDFYYINNQFDEIKSLKNQYFLGVDEITKESLWERASRIYYLDNKPNYEILPSTIKKKIQPQFTNRDRNTFGKIAAKIGKRFSNSIQKELINGDDINSALLVNYFKYLPEAIAILECTLDTLMNDYIEEVKSIKVFEKSLVSVKVSVADSEPVVIIVNHYVDTEKDYSIYLSKSSDINTNKQMAEAITEVFLNMLGRDTRKYSSDLLRYLNALDKMDYLKDYDILPERISEIRDKLNTIEFTKIQKFWDAILSATGRENREGIFICQEIDVSEISNILGVDEKNIISFNNNFNFSFTSNPLNIELLTKLLIQLKIKLVDLNKFLFPKIDFREFYSKRLIGIKNKFENSFNEILYTYLLVKSDDDQEKYQNLLDSYKDISDFCISLNILSLDVEVYFIEFIKNKFSYIEITVDNLKNYSSTFDSAFIYKNNFIILENEIISTGLNTKNLDLFLSDNSKRSLLYFTKTQKLISLFKDWLRVNENDESKNDSELEDYLKSFCNPDGLHIESISTSEIDNQINAGKNGNTSGNRFDGSINDQIKITIGLVAEMVVYDKLKSLYKTVNWVSKFASKIYKTHHGYNPEGQDGLGYDIEYLDDDGNKFYVEVKGKSDSFESFEITRKEIEKAQIAKEYYKILFVTDTLSNSQRRIKDLGNLFAFEIGEDILSNKKFKAIYKNFEIRFQEQ